MLARWLRSRWLRIAVVLGLLAFIATRVDWSRVLDRLREGRWEWFAAAVGVLIAALLLGALRWRVLLRRERGVRSSQVAYAYAIGVFTNGFLPTSFGGDMARAWTLSRSSGMPLPRVIASVVVDRMLGFAAVFVVGWLLITTDLDAVPRSILVTLGWATAAAILAFGLTLLATEDRSGRLRRVVPQRIQPALRQLRDALRGYARDPATFGVAALLSVAYQSLVVCEMWFIAEAVSVDISAAVFAAVLPLVLVATLLPFSIGGLGIREGSIVLLLTQVGIDTSDATVVSLLSLAALTLATGAFGLLLIGKPVRDLSPRAESQTSAG